MSFVSAWAAKQPNGGRILPENMTLPDVLKVLKQIEKRIKVRAKNARR